MYPTLKLLDAGTDAAVRIAPDEPPPTMIPWKIPNKEIKLGAGARSGKRQLVSVSKAELEAGFNHGLCGVAYGLPQRNRLAGARHWAMLLGSERRKHEVK